MEDIIRDLGFLCLGSRMKRLGETLQAHTQTIIDDWDLPVQASQFPLIAAIDRLGRSTVGQLAEAIGASQPGVTRTLLQLEDLELVEISVSSEDQRRKSVALTRNGKKLAALAKREVWPRIHEAVFDLCKGADGDLLEQLSHIEDALAAKSLQMRAPPRPKRGRK